jgi:serine phosphatase RsbU (regulator of sigma subunit)
VAAGPAGDQTADLGPVGRPAVTDAARTGGIAPARATTIVAVIGLVLTLTVSWTAWTLDRHTEHRLLQIQTRQAAAVLSSTILTLRNPLETALRVEMVTGGSTDEFERFAATYVTPHGPFVAAVLWTSDGATWRPVATAGVRPLLTPDGPTAHALVRRSLSTPTFAVAPVPADRPRRVGYAVADPATDIAIYAERAVPADRVVPVESTSAFADLDFATYLGPTTDPTALTTTDLPLSQLPLTGDVARVAIPFGDSSVTLVTAPRGPLGGTSWGALPWVFLVGGLLVTAAAAAVTFQIVRRRRSAEEDARTIAGLYRQLDERFGEQRSVVGALQQALLPQRNPTVPHLEIGSTYLSGTHGLEIGGDWFSLIEIDDRHFGFVVGDVSGKGVGAAAIMARLRFTIRAYLIEGHPPDVVLAMCSRQLRVDRDGHLATAVIGVGDTESGVLTLANAGHLRPMLVTGASSEFVATDVGLPLGVTPCTYRPTTLRLTSGDAVVAFTDGLVERRGELLDVGLDRVLRASTGPTATVGELLGRLTATLGSEGPSDDVTALAFRWTRPDGSRDTVGATSDRAH